MKHLTIRSLAYLAWAAVGVAVVGVNAAEAMLRYAPGRRVAARVYTLGARR